MSFVGRLARLGARFSRAGALVLCLLWPAAALPADASRPVESGGEGVVVVAVDTLAQRAVIRLQGNRPIVVSKGHMVPGSSMLVTAIMVDRIEVESMQADGRRQRMWWLLDAAGKADGISLEAKPQTVGYGVAPAHGFPVTGRPR